MPDTDRLRVTDLRREYHRGPQTVRALDGVSFSIRKGEFLSVVGSSGSGKTTLLNLLAGLDTATAGTVEYDGISLGSMSRRELSDYRAHKIGIVFQSFNLLPHYTAFQNVETALLFTDTAPSRRKVLASSALERLGLSDRFDHRPSDLSGGEQQRVAIARAIVKNPEILFADEPTGNLDHENADQIAEILTRMNKEGLTIIIVTHNLDFARTYTHRIITMKYGKISGDSAGTVSAGDHPG